jgi:hypothetical protein
LLHSSNFAFANLVSLFIILLLYGKFGLKQ